MILKRHNLPRKSLILLAINLGELIYLVFLLKRDAALAKSKLNLCIESLLAKWKPLSFPRKKANLCGFSLF